MTTQPRGRLRAIGGNPGGKPSGSFASDDPDRPRWGFNTLLVAEYDYQRADGTYAFTVRRGNNPNGEKAFTIGKRNQLSFGARINLEDKAEWFPGMEGEAHTLYRLPSIIAAESGSTIYIAEGEKDADNVALLGLNATTNSSGAGKWRDEFSVHLAGHDVVVLCDQDDAGREHARKVVRSVHGIARSVKVIEFLDLPEKGDVSDWLEAGHTKAELLELVQRAEPISDPHAWVSSAGQFAVSASGRGLESSPANARLALAKLGVSVAFDAFASRCVVAGLDGFNGPLDDAAMIRLRLTIEERFKLYFAKDRFYDIINDNARRRSFHPVIDYLDALAWDGVARLDTWLIEYGGAEDTEFVRTVGALPLIAAVRRVRLPGCKFDEMLVFESPQGAFKSSALRELAVKSEWFCDDLPLDADTRLVMERLAGRWIVEAAELKGLRRGEVEKVKAMQSRTVDKARLAYGRLPVEQPRQCVFFGTTNNDDYLRDATGNRRFWPVKIKRFDIEALRRDRDQLWAEAVVRERSGASIRLPERLWPAAQAEQEKRQTLDPFFEALSDALDGREGKIRSEAVWHIVGMSDPAKRSQDHNNRIGAAMQALGWTRKKARFSGSKAIWGYRKGDSDVEVRLDAGSHVAM